MKLNRSKQRELIYETVMCLDIHPTAEEIYTLVKKEMPNISLGTVYRNLNLLSDLGKIRRISMPNGIYRFDKTLTEHFHFMCENCGKVFDLPYIDIKENFKGLNVQIKSVDLNVCGLCQKCKNKN